MNPTGLYFWTSPKVAIGDMAPLCAGKHTQCLLVRSRLVSVTPRYFHPTFHPLRRRRSCSLIVYLHRCSREQARSSASLHFGRMFFTHCLSSIGVQASKARSSTSYKCLVHPPSEGNQSSRIKKVLRENGFDFAHQPSGFQPKKSSFRTINL